ncbi:hypothetical protein [Cerasicoccus frondis]|uniref:hypothetical protein n=1 Tax=Cerasicoccus frondis TaxID=490090 RepID=UPI002852B649|nr:hypothetical protein [Cerasicoccus frondis]
MSENTTISEMRQRLIDQSLHDQWWLATDGVTQPEPITLLAIESAFRSSPRCKYQLCHAQDDAANPDNWRKLTLPSPPRRKMLSRGHVTVFRGGIGHEADTKSVTPFPQNLSKALEKHQTIPTQLHQLAEMVESLHQTMQHLLQSSERAQQFDERERNLREMEDLICDKAKELEEERVELQQLRDELKRQSFRVGSA